MATWRVKTPDGREYEVDTPTGASESDAIAYVRDHVEPKEAATPAAPQEQRSMVRDALRQPGLATRYAIEGVSGLPAMFVDPFQKVAGGRTMSEATSSLLDRMGLPKPETPAENVSNAISRAIAGGGGFAKLAGYLPKVVGLPEMADNLLAQKPLQQAVQAGIGGGASEVTRQAGGGLLAQLMASALTPLVATSTANIIGAGGRGLREAVRPVTRAGAEQVAADVLGGVASNKQAAIKNLEQYNSVPAWSIGVPGSKPTSGAVSADYGLIGGEQLAARGPSNPDFAARFAANNQAQLDDLAKLRANPEQIAAYEARREAITAPLREQAFAKATGPVNYGAVADKIVEQAMTPEGGRENSRKALDWLAAKVKLYAEDGRTAPQYADALRMDIGDLVAGKISNEQGSIRLAAGVANKVKQTLTEEISKVAPGFNKYLETYSRLSKPIERLGVISDRLGGSDLSRVTNALPMAGPNGASFAMSQAKMRNQTGNIEAALPVSPRGLPLAPYQRDVLGRVMGDLNSATLAARGGKMPGSDTYQNMATANLLSSIFGKTLAEAGVPKAVSGPLNFAYKPLEQRIRNLVDEAYLDPKKMEALLRLARTKRSGPTMQDLITSSGQNIYGGLLGGAISQ